MQQDNVPLVFLLIIGTLVFLVLGALLIIFRLLLRQKQHKNKQEKEQLKLAYEQEILQTRIEVQNQTLKHVSQDLYDNIGQLLTVLRLYLNQIEEAITLDEAREQVTKTNTILDQAISDVRSITHSLDCDQIRDLGLLESLALEIERLRKTDRFKIELAVAGKAYKLGYQRELVIFRLLQEVITTTIKHSGASRLDVIMDYKSEGFIVTVHDNGLGFDLEEALNHSQKNTGSSLRNMQRRVKVIGGTCVIHKTTGKGTTTELAIRTVVRS